MTVALALPTQKDEAWRYAPPAAIASVWPVRDEAIHVSAGAPLVLSVVVDANEAGATGDAARHIVLELAAGAEADLTLVNIAGADIYSRIAVTVRLGRASRLHIGGVQVAGGHARLEIVTEVIHAEPDAVSRQTIRSVVGEAGQVTYLGRVRVDKGADGTDGSQSVRAMLLDRRAQANARPELEIYADDVKCAHGCAVGELDAASLFYLAQRGLPPADAKALLLQAFLAEGLEGAEDADHLRGLVAARLSALTETSTGGGTV